jgi:hypothetical protein
MKVYHGTIKQYAERIKREGLKPEPARAFRLADLKGIELRDAERVQAHVTLSPVIASVYAKFRADYEEAPKGQWIEFGGVPWYQKTTDEQLQDATPVVVEFHLPVGWPLRQDEMDPKNLAFVTPSIPADYVTGIREVRQ